MVDTNVWIDLFRGERAAGEGRRAAEVWDGPLAQDWVLCCGVVETELFQGVRDDERPLLEAQLDALAFVETERADFRAAGGVLNGLRRKGVTIATPDALIVALCLRHGLALLERDGHFAEIGGLRLFPWHRQDGDQ